METNRAEACREQYRGSFKKAQIVACFAGINTLVILFPAAMLDYLPD